MQLSQSLEQRRVERRLRRQSGRIAKSNAESPVFDEHEVVKAALQDSALLDKHSSSMKPLALKRSRTAWNERVAPLLAKHAPPAQNYSWGVGNPTWDHALSHPSPAKRFESAKKCLSYLRNTHLVFLGNLKRLQEPEVEGVYGIKPTDSFADKLGAIKNRSYAEHPELFGRLLQSNPRVVSRQGLALGHSPQDIVNGLVQHGLSHHEALEYVRHTLNEKVS